MDLFAVSVFPLDVQWFWSTGGRRHTTCRPLGLTLGLSHVSGRGEVAARLLPERLLGLFPAFWMAVDMAGCPVCGVTWSWRSGGEGRGG